MSLRTRLTVAAVLAVALAMAVATTLSWLAVRSIAYERIDRSLQRQARLLDSRDDDPSRLRPRPAPRGEASVFLQVVDGAGRIVATQGVPTDRSRRGPQRQAVEPVEVTDVTRRVLAGDGDRLVEDQEVAGQSLRVLTVRVRGGAVQLVRSSDEVEETLTGVRSALAAVFAGAVLLALAASVLGTRIAATPVRRLEQGVAQVAERRDLRLRVDVAGNDEISRLAQRFNDMLDALAAAEASQHRLVQDASHELRTPLTSIRTNLEVLAMSGGLDASDRELLVDVDMQIVELADLVAKLVELAHGSVPAGEREMFDLAEVAEEAVRRGARWARGRASVRYVAGSWTVHADRARVQSAVDNLVDNAISWTAAGTTVDVAVEAGGIAVCDEGPGVADDDAPHVFDRFYRAPAARSRPGSGLGLSIVREVATAHGGNATVSSRGDRAGACFRLALPRADAVAGAAGTDVGGGLDEGPARPAGGDHGGGSVDS